MRALIQWSIVLAACFVVMNCASETQQRTAAMEAKLNPLIGHSIADAVIGHGPPTSQIDLGANKRLFQWQGTTNTPGAVLPIGGALVAVPSQQKNCIISLIAVSTKPSPSLLDWIVESYSWNGVCPA